MWTKKGYYWFWHTAISTITYAQQLALSICWLKEDSDSTATLESDIEVVVVKALHQRRCLGTGKNHRKIRVNSKTGHVWLNLFTFFNIHLSQVPSQPVGSWAIRYIFYPFFLNFLKGCLGPGGRCFRCFLSSLNPSKGSLIHEVSFDEIGPASGDITWS